MALRKAREEGVWACCRALKKRFAGCRPLYSVFYSSTSAQWQVELVDGTILYENEVATFVLEPYRAALFPHQFSSQPERIKK